MRVKVSGLGSRLGVTVRFYSRSVFGVIKPNELPNKKKFVLL